MVSSGSGSLLTEGQRMMSKGCQSHHLREKHNICFVPLLILSFGEQGSLGVETNTS